MSHEPSEARAELEPLERWERATQRAQRLWSAYAKADAMARRLHAKAKAASRAVPDALANASHVAWEADCAARGLK